MTRNLASAFSIAADVAAAAAAAAIVVCGSAFADDITVDGTPFVGAKTRAEVQNEFKSQAQLATPGAQDWLIQSNQLPQVKSAYTSAEAKAEYKASRDYVRALNAEDGGSAYVLKSTHAGTNPAAQMGGPSRDYGPE